MDAEIIQSAGIHEIYKKEIFRIRIEFSIQDEYDISYRTKSLFVISVSSAGFVLEFHRQSRYENKSASEQNLTVWWDAYKTVYR